MDRFVQVDRQGVAANPGEDYDYPYVWESLGSLTTEITTPAVDGRDDTTIQALIDAGSVLELEVPNAVYTGNAAISEPNGAVSYELALVSTGNEDDDYVLDILAAAGSLVAGVVTPGHYTRRATITGTQGQQEFVAGTSYFHDSVVGSNEAWLTDPTDVPGTARANYIGSYLFNVHGYISFVFVPITIPRGTLTVNVRRFS